MFPRMGSVFVVKVQGIGMIGAIMSQRESKCTVLNRSSIIGPGEVVVASR